MPYATEAELLEFANAVRRAGGANVLDALMPSAPEDAKACLIANALNFSCQIVPAYKSDTPELLRNDHGEDIWSMELPHNMSFARGREIAAALGLEFETYFDRWDGHRARRRRKGRILLPRLIGNTAAAFDAEHHKGWVAKYRKPA